METSGTIHNLILLEYYYYYIMILRLYVRPIVPDNDRYNENIHQEYTHPKVGLLYRSLSRASPNILWVATHQDILTISFIHIVQF